MEVKAMCKTNGNVDEFCQKVPFVLEIDRLRTSMSRKYRLGIKITLRENVRGPFVPKFFCLTNYNGSLDKGSKEISIIHSKRNIYKYLSVSIIFQIIICIREFSSSPSLVNSILFNIIVFCPWISAFDFP